MHINGGGTIPPLGNSFGGNSSIVTTFDVNNNGDGSQNGVIQLNGASPGWGVSTILNVTGGNGYSLDIASIKNTAGSVGTETFNPTTAALSLGTITATQSSGTNTFDLDGTNAANGVTGIISNSSTGAISAITKSNTSTWTLSGANTYTGATSVTGGTLRVANGSSGSATGTGAVTVNSGTTFGVSLAGGSATVSPTTVTINTGATLTGANGVTLTANNGMTFQPSTTTTVSLTGTPSGNSGSNPMLAVTGGNLTVTSGIDTINLTGTPSVGAYDLVNYTGATVGGSGNFVLGSNPGGFVYQLQLNTGIKQLDLAVVGAVSWTGAGSDSNWTTSNADTNWASGSFPTASASQYLDTVAVTFADTNPLTGSNVTNSSVAIQSAGVNPGSVSFTNNTVAYTINSTGSAVGIGGSTGVTLSGTGMVTFVGPNTYTGTTTLNAGTLVVSNNNSLGSTSGTVAPLTFNGGTLRYAAIGSTNTDISGRVVTISSGGATIDINGNNVSYASSIGNGGSGALTVVDSGSAATLTLAATNAFSGAVNLNGGTVNFSSTGGGSLAGLGTGNAINFNGGALQWANGTSTDISAQTVTIGAGGATLDINGNNVNLASAIGNGGSGGLTLLNSAGPATPAILTLAAANTYTGTTNVNGGTLRVANTSNSATGSGSVNVNSGGTLAGNGVSLEGFISGNVTVASGGTLSPSGGGVAGAPATVGKLTVGGLTLNSTGGATLNYQVTSSSSLDAIAVAGALVLPTSNTTTFNFYQPGTTNEFLLGAGTYQLMTYQSIIGGGANLNSILAVGIGNNSWPVGDTATFSTTSTSGPGVLDLTIGTAGSSSATWIGTTFGDGKYGTGANWSTGVAPSGVGLMLPPSAPAASRRSQ